jgi:hypothetical protein
MSGSANSGRSRSFELAAAFLLLAALSAAALAWFSQRGYTLYYGDSEAHLNIARRILDSRTPGPYQIGTVWLPLPHLLMLPLVGFDGLWRSGLGGSVSSAICFVIAGLFLFASARRIYGDGAAAAATLAVFALNPNLLYLQSTPMTEAVFRDTQSIVWAAAAGLASAAASLARYEGWFLIPFVTLYFLFTARRRRLLTALLVGSIASAGPLLWLAHNWWYWGDFLEFYRGPYSAKAIYQRQLEAGMARYRGDHNLRDAWLYYRSAAELCVGWGAISLGLAGAVAALFKRAIWPLLLLLAPAAFYVWGIYAGEDPLFVPHLWPNSYYNTRFGLVVLLALAIAAGALVTLVPARWRTLAVVLVAGLAAAPWLQNPRPESWICWKESQVNSAARRAWTKEAAAYLRERYQPGTGIITSSGDLNGVLREAGIPLRETLNEDNGVAWDAAVASPGLFLNEEWVLAVSGDRISTALARAGSGGSRYDCGKTIAVKGAPVIQICRR